MAIVVLVRFYFGAWGCRGGGGGADGSRVKVEPFWDCKERMY